MILGLIAVVEFLIILLLNRMITELRTGYEAIINSQDELIQELFDELDLKFPEEL